METKERVKKLLTENYGYDFDSDFWTDEMLAMFDEIVWVTKITVMSNLTE